VKHNNYILLHACSATARLLHSWAVAIKRPNFGVGTGGTRDIVKAKSSGEDPRATGGLVSNLPHPRVNRTKQHTKKENLRASCDGL